MWMFNKATHHLHIRIELSHSQWEKGKGFNINYINNSLNMIRDTSDYSAKNWDVLFKNW